jgi:hypothetical protein
VYFIGACLIGVYLMGVHLMSVYLMGVHPIGVYLTGVHLTGVYSWAYVSKSKKALGKTSRSPTLQTVVDLLRSELEFLR